MGCGIVGALSLKISYLELFNKENSLTWQWGEYFGRRRSSLNHHGAKMEDSFFVSTTFAKNGTPVGDVLELCREQKIVNVELGSNHAYEADPIKVVQQFTCNYLVHNYFPAPKEMLIVNIASLDDTIYKRSKQHIFRSLDFCQKIGAKLYTFHPGFLSDPKGESKSGDNYDFQ